MKSISQNSAASGRPPFNGHQAARTRYNEWSQQWWSQNFRDGEPDDFIVAAVSAGFRREVKLNYGPESVGHIPLLPAEIDALPLNRSGKREHVVEDSFERKIAIFGNVPVSDDDTSGGRRPSKRVRRVGRDKSNSIETKVQSETLLSRVELDSGGSDSSVPDARPEPLGPANPLRKNSEVVTGTCPNTEAPKRHKSLASYTDTSDKQDEKAKAEGNGNGYHSAFDGCGHKIAACSAQCSRSGSHDYTDHS